MIQRRTILRAGLALPAVGLLSACGQPSGNGTAPSNGAGGTPAGKAGGVAIISNSADAAPQFVMANRAGNPWVSLVYEKLVTVDPQTFDVTPGIAKSWEFSADGLTASFELDEGITFHSGRDLTAEDVIYSMEQAANPENGSQLAFLAERIAGMSADGASRLTMTFSQPTPNILDLLDLIPIVDSETFGAIADGRVVVGTGPFTWDVWTPGAQIDFSKYADFRRADNVKLDGVQMNVITDSTAMVSAMRSNSAHIALGMGPLDAKGIADSGDAYTLVLGTGSIYPIGLNPSTEALQSKEVRQAIAYGIDRQRIADQVFAGTATPTSLFWSTADAISSAEEDQFYTYDADKARELIAQAGGAGTITIQLPQYPAQQGEYEIIANNLSELGFTVESEILTAADYNQRQVDRNMGDAWLPNNGTSAWSASTILSANPNLMVGNNLSGWDDPQYEGLVEAFETADSDDARVAAGKELNAYILDQAWVLPIVAAPSPLVERGITGVRYSSNNNPLLENAALL